MARASEASRAAREGGRNALSRRKRASHAGRGVGVLATVILLGLPCAALTGTPAVESQVRIMTFNILRGGTALGQPISQTIFFRGKGVELNGVRIVGEDREHADVVVAPYPSDHSAVVASFTLIRVGAAEEGRE